MQLRFCLQRLYAMTRLLTYLLGSLVKVYFVPLEMKENCGRKAVQIGTQQNILVIFIMANIY